MKLKQLKKILQCSDYVQLIDYNDMEELFFAQSKELDEENSYDKMTVVGTFIETTKEVDYINGFQRVEKGTPYLVILLEY